jgi:hypothetical protein
MTDVKTLLRLIQTRATFFAKEDEAQLREIAATVGGFTIVRRGKPGSKGKSRKSERIEVKYRDRKDRGDTSTERN